MFSHIIILWTNPAVLNSTQEVISGATRCLKGIPGLTHFHVGSMARSDRHMVDQTFQVAVNMTFENREALENYHSHPFYADFVRNVYRPFCSRVKVYDFES